MDGRLDHAMVLAQQFPTSIAADLTKLVVGVEDGSPGVGDADDGVLVQGEFLIVQGAPIGLPVGHQPGEQRRDFLQIGLAHLALGGSGRHQAGHQFAQGRQGPLPARQLLPQAIVGLGQFGRGKLQAAGAQIQVPVELLEGRLDPGQKIREPRNRGASSGTASPPARAAAQRASTSVASDTPKDRRN